MADHSISIFKINEEKNYKIESNYKLTKTTASTKMSIVKLQSSDGEEFLVEKKVVNQSEILRG